MRKDHRPKWLRNAFNGFERAWTRRFLAPQFDALGANAQIVRPWFVEVFGTGISAGDHLHALASADMRIRLTTWPAPDETATIDLGNAVLLTGGVRLNAARAITVGDGTMFAAHALVSDCDWHGLYDRVEAGRGAQAVHIGTNVWVGDGAFIGKGVTIGDHAVVGARAVVVKDVPPCAIVAGNPARVVGQLDPDQPMRTRMDLFATPGLGDFYEAEWAAKFGDATFLNWLRVKLAPGRGD